MSIQIVARIKRQRGVSLMESMVSLVLVSIVGLALSISSITAMHVEKRTEAHYAASSLAASRVEELAAVDILNLTSSANESNTSVSWPGLDVPFKRTTSVVVNADRSRTITVTVASSSSSIPVTVSFSTNFANWE